MKVMVGAIKRTAVEYGSMPPGLRRTLAVPPHVLRAGAVFVALEGAPWSNQSAPARKQLTGMKVMVRTIKCTAVDYGSMPPGLRRALAVPQRQPFAGEFRGGAATPEE